MKKIVDKMIVTITCLMMAAVIFIPSATSIVGATETAHSHAFTNGRCECGSALFEAETADLSGTSPSSGNTTNIGSNAAASGGGLVNNWSVAGNEIVWTFSIDKSATASIELVLSPCEAATTFSSTLSLTVNGASVGMKDDNIRGIAGEQWHNYTAFETENVNFKKGDVRIVLKAKRAYNVNIDCLRVNFAAADDVKVGAFNILPSDGEHNHLFSEGACECGAMIFEAEDGAIQGTPTFSNPDFSGTNKGAHGGRLVGNWGNGDNLLTWTLNADQAIVGATIDMVFASCTSASRYALPTEVGSSNANWPFELRAERTIDGNTVKNTVLWQSASVAPMPSDNWHDYRAYSSKPVDFAAGENLIKLEAYNSYSMNIDYIVVNLPDSEPPVRHTHAFTESRCECGSALFEAETGEVTGASSDPNGESMIGIRTESSGGGLVKNFATAGNKITWKFDLDQEYENVPATVYMAPCDSVVRQIASVSFTVNGAPAAFTATEIPAIAGDAWHDYKPFEVTGFNLGTSNIIVFENVAGINLNIDYMILGLPVSAVVSEYSGSVEPPPVPHTHAFTGDRCECGAVKLEAENAVVQGTPTFGNETFLEETPSASGGWNIANWAEGDNILTFEIEVSADCENVAIGMTFAPVTSNGSYVLPTTDAGADFNSGKGGALWPFLLRVNESFPSGRGFSSAHVPLRSGDGYHDWRTVYSNPVSLTQGTNKIEIEACDHYAMNIDYIFIEVAPEVNITMEIKDNAAPIISAISVDPSDPKAGGEVTFSFTVSDNVSAVDKITVDTKVYLNYGRAEQREIDCANNKFTPAEAGKYTVVVNATDEAGKTSQKLRAITVTSAQPSEDEPSGDNPSGDNPNGDAPAAEEGGCGSLAFGVPVIIIFALTALTVLLARVIAKKKR